MKLVNIFLIVLCGFIGNAQEGDTLEFEADKKYSQKFLDSLMTSPDFPFSIEELRIILEKNNQLTGWVFYHNRKASIAINSQKLDSALIHLNKVLKHPELKSKTQFIGSEHIRAYNLLGYTHSVLKDYERSTLAYQKALDLSKTYPYKWGGFLLVGIARNHMESGDNDLALQYYLKASKDTTFMSLPRPAVTTNSKLAALYFENNDLDSAEYFYRNALDESFKGSFKADIGIIYAGLGFLNYNKDNRDSAYHYFKMAVEGGKMYETGHNSNAELTLTIASGFVNFYENRYKEASNDLNGVMDTILSFEDYNRTDKAVILLTAEILGKTYTETKNTEGLFTLLNKSNKFLEEYHILSLDDQINDLEIAYQTKEKDASIELLKIDQTQKETIISQQRIIAIVVGTLLVLIMASGYLFFRQRRLKSYYETESLKQRLLLLQMNPHFIGNVLNNIAAMIKKGSDNTITYLNKMTELFRTAIVHSQQEFVSLDEEIKMLENYMELQSKFSTEFDFTISVDGSLDRETAIVPPMLLQPFVENSILHGFNKKSDKKLITITILKDLQKHVLCCEISDNGVGIEKSGKKIKKHSTSLSGDIIKQRLEILKKKYKVNAHYLVERLTSGTRVKIYLPYLIDV